jgi:hypothetical protein
MGDFLPHIAHSRFFIVGRLNIKAGFVCRYRDKLIERDINLDLTIQQ